MRASTRQWIVDGLVGGAIGAVIGAIVVVNFVITVGIDAGYEASIPEIFRESAVAGVVTVLILVAGPVLGVLVARRLRRAHN
jgi:uncharacterized membrane protein